MAWSIIIGRSTKPKSVRGKLVTRQACPPCRHTRIHTHTHVRTNTQTHRMRPPPSSPPPPTETSLPTDVNYYRQFRETNSLPLSSGSAVALSAMHTHQPVLHQLTPSPRLWLIASSPSNLPYHLRYVILPIAVLPNCTMPLTLPVNYECMYFNFENFYRASFSLRSIPTYVYVRRCFLRRFCNSFVLTATISNVNVKLANGSGLLVDVKKLDCLAFAVDSVSFCFSR